MHNWNVLSPIHHPLFDESINQWTTPRFSEFKALIWNAPYDFTGTDRKQYSVLGTSNRLFFRTFPHSGTIRNTCKVYLRFPFCVMSIPLSSKTKRKRCSIDAGRISGDGQCQVTMDVVKHVSILYITFL